MSVAESRFFLGGFAIQILSVGKMCQWSFTNWKFLPSSSLSVIINDRWECLLKTT